LLHQHYWDITAMVVAVATTAEPTAATATATVTTQQSRLIADRHTGACFVHTYTITDIHHVFVHIHIRILHFPPLSSHRWRQHNSRGKQCGS
jgi:hypothetical protein